MKRLFLGMATSAFLAVSAFGMASVPAEAAAAKVHVGIYVGSQYPHHRHCRWVWVKKTYWSHHHKHHRWVHVRQCWR